MNMLRLSGFVRRSFHASPSRWMVSTLSADDDGSDISKIGISREIVTALAKKGIINLFPNQRAVLEPAMQGGDLIIRHKTGTRMTLAFGIHIMHQIIQYNEEHGRGRSIPRSPLAIVMSPTRELACQVQMELYESAPSLDIMCVHCSSPIKDQISTLHHGVDVIVGTPGRVMGLLRVGALNLSEVRFAVIYGVDQLLDVGFADAVEAILRHLLQNHQTMLFSTAMPSWIMKLTYLYLKSPLTIDLVTELAAGITLYSIMSEVHVKPSIIGPLIVEHANGGKCIIFTQTMQHADGLAYALQKSFRCEPLHGDISQSQRERTLSSFTDGTVNVLVATDVAAHGLDDPNVALVIHYEPPNSSEVFVHRCGHTGRAGKKGSVILMYSSQQWKDVKAYERQVGCIFTELPPIGVDYVPIMKRAI